MDKREKIIAGIMGALLVGSVSLVGLLFTVDPVAVKQRQFTYEIHSEIPTTAENYLNANEKVLENAVINLSDVQIDQIGIYTAYAEYAGKQYPFTIQIRDTEAPIASLIQTKYEIKVGDTLIAADLVKDIQDASEYIVYFDEEDRPKTKAFTEVKTYNDVFIIVEDIYGNRSNKLRLSVVVSQDNEAPTFSGVDNKVVKLGSLFNALEGVRANDKTDGDLTTSIKVTGMVDTNTAGSYTLTYTVSDLSGNITTVNRTITVQIDGVDEADSVQDVANGPYLPKEKYRQLEGNYLTISRAMFTATNHLDLVKQMNDYLVKFTKYLPADAPGKYANSSYGAICNNAATDEGFARAFLYMCQQQKIDCYYVEGTYNNMEMVWNIVKVGENYYHIDVAYERIYGTGFQLLSTSEMKELGYAFDESYYPQCTKKFSN